MDRISLLKSFNEVTKKTGFIPKKGEEPYMPQLKPGQHRSVIAHGIYNGKKAILKVSPYEHYTAINNDFASYRSAVKSLQSEGITAPLLSILPPSILAIDVGSKFMIQDDVCGDRIILTYSYPFNSYPESTPESKDLVARIYWDTRKAFGYATGLHPIGNDCGRYFMSRYSQYTKTRIETKSGNVYVDRDLENRAFGFIFDNVKNISMQPSFSHFANTDIVKSGDFYYIIDAAIVQRPEMYEAAFWLWGATMYAHNIPSKKWIRELEEWKNIFIKKSPYGDFNDDLRLKLDVCLVERMLGTLMVDVPLCRSPFDELIKAAAVNEIVIARSVIEHIISKYK